MQNNIELDISHFFIFCYAAACFFLIPNMAEARGRSRNTWIIISLIITPVWATVLLALLGPPQVLPPSDRVDDNDQRIAGIRSELRTLEKRIGKTVST